MRASLFALVLLTAACADAPETTDAPTETVVAPETLTAAPTPGAQAPPFDLVDTAGETHALAGYRGQTVVLEWLNYDCPYVGKHYGGGAMQARQQQAEADGVVWLSVVSSAPGQQGHFEPEAMDARTASEGGRQAAVLLDPTGEVGQAYGAKTTPHMFVIDPDGTVVYNGAIDDRPTTDLADLEGARDYVADALAALAAGRPADPATTPPYGCSVKYAADA
ncbi:redoxin domain-containing protein [Rubrivirga sp. IMCC45206]|uniref:redoxin domain-containing protein n=1 Tax=Rubrivirga sp. IMCC45206 TaxID=3391614 RepID=UPI0039902BFE